MCLNPLKLRSPTKSVSIYGGQQLFLTVPCGKCAECLTNKRQEWYMRSYYEVQDTLSKGGYIYFDTLTYNDANLPRLGDFVDLPDSKLMKTSCFNHSHFKLFLKRLRRQLEYKYGTNKFKYFLCSEYGTDDRFTHRPHYHILFYITSNINPFDFSMCVSSCWTYGRTDGLPYKTPMYVSNHIYGYSTILGNNAQFKSISSVCNYVSKYITKSSKFTEVLNKRMYKLMTYIEDVEVLKDIRHQVDMFHRQSQGFGLSYISNIDDEKKNL